MRFHSINGIIRFENHKRWLRTNQKKLWNENTFPFKCMSHGKSTIDAFSIPLQVYEFGRWPESNRQKNNNKLLFFHIISCFFIYIFLVRVFCDCQAHCKSCGVYFLPPSISIDTCLVLSDFRFSTDRPAERQNNRTSNYEIRLHTPTREKQS